MITEFFATLAPTPGRHSRMLRSALLAAAPVGAILLAPSGAQAFAPVTALDNIGSAAFPGSALQRPLSEANIVSKAFTTPNNGKLWNISSLELALASGSGTPQSRIINITLYSTAPGICGSGTTNNCQVPTGSALATYSFTGNYSTAGLGGNGYTLLQAPSQLGSLNAFTLQPNTSYSLVFSSAGTPLNWRLLSGPPTASQGFIFLNSAGSVNASNPTTNVSVGSWTALNTTEANNNAFTLGVTEQVPLSPFAGIPVLAGALRFSRGLRKRVTTSI